jgi:DNA polymerase-1
MLRVDRALAAQGMASRMILQVHDELVLEVPEAEADRAEALVRTAMEGAAALRVPLDVEVGRASSWAEAH